MSQAGRALNGGLSGYFLYLQFVDILSNANQTFIVDSLGNVTCNSLTAKTFVTAESFLQIVDGVVVNLEDQIIDLQNRVSVLETEVADLQSRVSTLESEVADLQTRVSNLESEVNDLESRVSTLESEVADLQGDVYTLSARPYTQAFANVEFASGSYTTLSSDNCTVTPLTAGVIGVNVISKPTQYLGLMNLQMVGPTPTVGTVEYNLYGFDFILHLFDLTSTSINTSYQIVIQ